VVFDFLPEVAERYVTKSTPRSINQPLEIWKHRRQSPSVIEGSILRIQGDEAFRLHWTDDDWNTIMDTDSTPTKLSLEYVDLPVPVKHGATLPIRFTFFWKNSQAWEGMDYVVIVEKDSNQ